VAVVMRRTRDMAGLQSPGDRRRPDHTGTPPRTAQLKKGFPLMALPKPPPPPTCHSPSLLPPSPSYHPTSPLSLIPLTPLLSPSFSLSRPPSILTQFLSPLSSIPCLTFLTYLPPFTPICIYLYILLNKQCRLAGRSTTEAPAGRCSQDNERRMGPRPQDGPQCCVRAP